MTTGWGVLTHVSGGDGPAAAYERTIRLAREAEAAGYGSFWVAQHRFGAQRAHLPSPLVLLAAVARETSTISLGTASIAAALEDPKRLAEDAAVVDALSGARLHLGLGSGSEPAASAAWGVDHEARHEVFWQVVDELTAILGGGPMGGESGGRGTPPLHPAAPSLRSRLWVTAGSAATARAAAERELGLIVGRRRVGPEGLRAEDDRVAGVIDGYREAGGTAVAVSRPVVATASPSVSVMVRREERRVRGTDAALTISTGPAGDLLRELGADPAVRRADRVLFHTRPIDIPLRIEVESLNALARTHRGG